MYRFLEPDLHASLQSTIATLPVRSALQVFVLRYTFKLNQAHFNAFKSTQRTPAVIRSRDDRLAPGQIRLGGETTGSGGTTFSCRVWYTTV